MTIILDHIEKRNEKGEEVLHGFTLEVEDDKSYIFTGPEGCGKSLLLKIFLGLERPEGGEVVRMGDYKYPTLQSSYVSQEGSLQLKKNAVWNVRKAHRTVTKGRAMEELLRFLPEQELSLSASELSPVSRRFTELVKALFVPSDFIVLDEPFQGMSRPEREKALAYIMQKKGRRPLLIAARDTEGLDFGRTIDLSAR